MENWRKLKEDVFLFEKVNSLSSNKRYVNDRLLEITSEDPRNQFPLSEKELNKIKHQVHLEGAPDFLGSGSQGGAWRFGNKVLKITKDSSEAHAAYLLVGKGHSNVYKIFLVARRDSEDLETLQHMPYIIVYELLDYPTNAMADVTNNLFHKIKKNNIFYNWDETYLARTKSLMRTLVKHVNKQPETLGVHEKGRNFVPKLENIAAQLGFDKLETKLLVTLWTFEHGSYNNSLASPLSSLEHVKSIFSNPKTNYLNQLLLGLTWLNKNGIVFSDLKTSNVMEKDGQIAIIDIGYSQVREKKNIPAIGEL